MKPGVYITIDVECSLGGAWRDASVRPVPPERGIWGRYSGRELGVPLIVDILRTGGLAGTFFVEPFNEELGYPGGTEEVCRYLIDAGQDVQLHIHPNRAQYALCRRGEDYTYTDTLADLPPAEQVALIAEGSRRLERATGRAPTAFRAGNMGASEAVLPQLAQAGIGIDSSYTFAFAGGQCGFSDRQPFNGSRWYGKVLELALSGFYQARVPGLRPAKVLDVMGLSAGECCQAIRSICNSGAEAVLILHSFSLFKVRNRQYDGGRPNRVVIGRFRRLCRWLACHSNDYPVRTFSELAEEVRSGRYEACAAPPPRILRPIRALARKAVQAANGLYWV